MKTKILYPWKKILSGSLLSFALIGSSDIGAQIMTDLYTSAGAWTPNGPTPPTISANQINFVGDPAVNCNFIYRPLKDNYTGAAFSLGAQDTWTLEFAFTPGAAINGKVPGHTLMAVTSGTDNTWNPCPGAQPYPYSNQNDVEVYYESAPAAPSSTWMVYAASKYGTVWKLPTTGVVVDPTANPGKTYYIRLQRLDQGEGQLSIFNDPAYTLPYAPPQCFTIDWAMGGLQYLQSGSIPQGGGFRAMNATINNLNIFKNQNCLGMTAGAYPSGFWHASMSSTTLVANGTACVFNGCLDGSDNRIDRSIGPLIANSLSWEANAEFTITGSSFTGPGHDILALTAGNGSNVFSTTPSSEDAIVAYVYGTGSSWAIYGRATKQGQSWLNPSNGITLPKSGSYYILLQRLCDGQGQISVYSDAAQTQHLPGSPQLFTIPTNVTGLNNVQIGAMQWGSSARSLTGAVQNVCVYNDEHDGGTIGSTQGVCAGSIPPAITEINAPNLGTCPGVTPTYFWEQNTGSGWTVISGATGATYTPPSLSGTTSYQRWTASTPLNVACLNWPSNIVTYTIAPANINLDISTGVVNGTSTLINVGSKDDTWKIAGLPGNSYPIIPAFSAQNYASCVKPVVVNTHTYWKTTPAGSQWISTEVNADGTTSVQLQSAAPPNAPVQQNYLYDYQFTVPSPLYTNLQVNITGLTVDNGATIYLNGIQEYALGDGVYGSFPFEVENFPGVIATNQADYNSSPANTLNTLLISVDNLGGYPADGSPNGTGDYSWTGVALQGNITGHCSTSPGPPCTNCPLTHRPAVQTPEPSRSEHPITYFPNPTTGNITIGNFCTSDNCSADILVTDLLGNIVYQKQGVEDSSITIDLSEQARGIYFIKVRTEGSEKIAKIVKN